MPERFFGANASDPSDVCIAAGKALVTLRLILHDRQLTRALFDTPRVLLSTFPFLCFMVNFFTTLSRVRSSFLSYFASVMHATACDNDSLYFN